MRLRRKIRTRFLHLCVVLALVWCITGAWAQSNDATAAQSVVSLKQKAVGGDANAQFQLGYAYAVGKGVPQDYAQAEVWYRKAADQGNVTAQINLAGLYEITGNETQAFILWRKFAELGSSYAQNKLGAKYANGKGAPQDYAQAVIWFRKAAEQGLASAQYNLGQSYRDGKGVPQDYLAALLWYRAAAEQGHIEAQFNLGALCDSGKGVAQDHAQAAVWWRKASEQGSPLAQYNLGMMYYNGQGVPQDYAEAYFWLDIAASGKLEDPMMNDLVKDRDEAASNVTKTVLLETQERARKWFENHPAKPQ